MAEGRVNNRWAFALASFPLWGTLLALAVIELTGSFTRIFGPDAEYLTLLQSLSIVIALWIYWMVGMLLLGLIDARQLQQSGVTIRGWMYALILLLPPAYFYARNRAVVAATGKDQPVFGWLVAKWVVSVAFNVIYYGLLSADQLLKIAKDSALLIAWVLVVAALWAIGERLYASLWKRS